MKTGFFARLFQKKAAPKPPKTARIRMSSQHYSTSYVLIDENGQTHTPPIPDPTVEEITAKPGEFTHGFEVVDVTEEYLLLRSDIEYMEDNGSTPRTEFIFKKDCPAQLRLCGLCDAVQKTTITYLGVSDEPTAPEK